MPNLQDQTSPINLDDEVMRLFNQPKMAKGGVTKILKVLRGEQKAEKAVDAAKDLRNVLEMQSKLTPAELAAYGGEELARLRSAELAPVATKGKAKELPKPDRTKPRTRAELEAIAQRVAPQLTGEFVRKPGKTENVVGKSRKQWDLEQELQHEMSRSRDVPEAKTIDLEPHRGSVMLSLPGDTSISDFDIFSIGGNQLTSPSRQYGGPRFGLAHPEEAGWASGIVPAAGFQRRVTEASQQYGDVPVIGNYMAMGPEGLNFAQHYADALLKSIKPGSMKERDIDAFNRAVRAGTEKHDFSDFPGIEHPEAAYLYMAENPAARKHFNSIMQLTKTTEALGLPSGLNVRHAITEPELRDLEPGMTGFSLMQMEPGVTHLKPSKHPTYSHDIPGEFMGRTDVLMPYELTFPDSLAAIREAKKPEFGTLQMMGGKQIIDNQLLDEIAQYREMLKKLTGKAKGGVAHPRHLAEKLEETETPAEIPSGSNPLYYEERAVMPNIVPAEDSVPFDEDEALRMRLEEELAQMSNAEAEPLIDLGALHSIKLASDPLMTPTPENQGFLPDSKMMKNQYYKAAIKLANKYGIPPEIFTSLIHHESRYNSSAENKKSKAYGLTQLTPDTAAYLKVDRFDPMQNLEGGAKYLGQLFKKFGSMPLALAAYNAGPGNVQKHGGIPPFNETKKYVKNILTDAGMSSEADKYAEQLKIVAKKKKAEGALKKAAGAGNAGK